MWRGVVWCGVVWCGVVWCGGVWWGGVGVDILCKTCFRVKLTFTVRAFKSS